MTRTDITSETSTRLVRVRLIPFAPHPSGEPEHFVRATFTAPETSVARSVSTALAPCLLLSACTRESAADLALPVLGAVGFVALALVGWWIDRRDAEGGES